jgi:tetratricopeptide (TPR) repeat protein
MIIVRKLKSNLKPITEAVKFYSYEITYEPVLDFSTYGVTKADISSFQKASRQLNNNPKKALPTLEKLVELYPMVPHFFNNLAFAYQKLEKYELSNNMVGQIRHKFPEYLFGRISYATECLKNNLEEIPKIFNGHYDLKLLYPERNVFHVSEVIAFFNLMGRYFAKKGEFQKAEIYLEVLSKLEHDNTGHDDLLLYIIAEKMFRAFPQRRQKSLATKKDKKLLKPTNT